MEKISKRDGKFIKDYNKKNNKGYILDDVEYPKRLHNLNSDLLFLPETMKTSKCNKPVCNLYDKKLCYLHESFKTKSWISTKKMYKVIKFNQKA